MTAAVLRRLEREVPGCSRCPRLSSYLRELGARYPDYWCRPVPSFGDRRARLAVVGLAPGLHGANRSGRPFYMDASGECTHVLVDSTPAICTELDVVRRQHGPHPREQTLKSVAQQHL